MPPAGDVFGLDGIFLTKSNPVVVSTIGINSTAAGAGIAVTGGSFSSGTVSLTFDTAAGLTTTPFYSGAKIAVSGLSSSTGIAYTGYNGTFVVTGFAGTTTVSYATTGYVGPVTAGITTTGLVILVSDTQVTNTIWSSAQTHGWFGGGLTPTTVSTVDRIDFSNDTSTASLRGPLSLARSGSAATGNSNYGWFGGGYAPFSPRSTVNRIDFSNDLAATSPRGPLSLARYTPSATGNSNYGWFGGGRGGSPTVNISTVDRIDFSNDSSTVSLRGTLSSSKYRGMGAAGNSNYGWFGGGIATFPTPLSTVDRIDFSNDSSTASVRGPLSLVRYSVTATGNSNYGWFGGGSNPSFSLSTVDRIDFSNDAATASVRGPLSLARYTPSATGNSNYGWFGGGGISGVYVSTVDRIDFSNDLATATARGPLSSARGYFSATSGQAKGPAIKLQKAGNFGWFGGGVNFALPPASAYTTIVQRIDFSNDSTTASPRGPLVSSRYSAYAFAATGNNNSGWFGGPSVTVDRIDFSNDSSTASPRGSLSAARGYLAATGNSNYGWFGGGFPAVATVDRINFSNDSVTASPRGPLSAARYQLAATGNSNYGWFGGGYPGAAVTNRVDRIDFSNDSSTASIRGSLSLARQQFAATSNTPT
ncbi:hypothetical protein EB118_08640 [bacterium]|nr:hypothetical protein [bacterium]